MGLSISELKQLELWEYNCIVESYNDKVIHEQKQKITQCYYTGLFNRVQKLKSLNYYLKQLFKTETSTVEDKKALDNLREKHFYNMINAITRNKQG